MPPCNGDCNQGRECICECKEPTNMVTVPLNKLEDMQRRLKTTQEPVAWMNDKTPSGIFARHKQGADNFGCDIPLYTHLPKQWQGLSDEEILRIDGLECVDEEYIKRFARAIEAKLREKNDG